MISLRFKKNITIRYQNSQLNHKFLIFKNMIKIYWILNINFDQRKNLTNQVEQWFKKTYIYTQAHQI